MSGDFYSWMKIGSVIVGICFVLFTMVNCEQSRQFKAYENEATQQSFQFQEEIKKMELQKERMRLCSCAVDD